LSIFEMFLGLSASASSDALICCRGISGLEYLRCKAVGETPLSWHVFFNAECQFLSPHPMAAVVIVNLR
jgi:hypothetical protein